MSTDGVEETITNGCQAGKRHGVARGGYWFEIIEIDDNNESQTYTNESNSSVCEENTTPSCVSIALEGVWTDLPWNCIICMQVFNSVSQLIEHNQDAHQKVSSDISWVCADCQITFRFYTTLLNHVRRMHRKNLLLVCDVCNIKCVSFEELDDHRREMHNDGCMSPILHCVTCGSGYRNKYHLLRHIESLHAIVKKPRVECSICKKTYRSKSSLIEHQVIHGTPKFACDQCGRRFTRRLTLEQHLITHSDMRSYHCRLCTKTFKTPVGLTNHIKSHANMKKPVTCTLFQCDDCQQLFRAKRTLNKHRNRYCKLSAKHLNVNRKTLNSNDQPEVETEDEKLRIEA